MGKREVRGRRRRIEIDSDCSYYYSFAPFPVYELLFLFQLSLLKHIPVIPASQLMKLKVKRIARLRDCEPLVLYVDSTTSPSSTLPFLSLTILYPI